MAEDLALNEESELRLLLIETTSDSSELLLNQLLAEIEVLTVHLISLEDVLLYLQELVESLLVVDALLVLLQTLFRKVLSLGEETVFEVVESLSIFEENLIQAVLR
jgi:hypothetical protein